MRTADFIKRHCIGTHCPEFDRRDGCNAYDGEECDAAFVHPRWRGLKMADRVIMLCEKRCKSILEAKNADRKKKKKKKKKEKIKENKRK